MTRMGGRRDGEDNRGWRPSEAPPAGHRPDLKPDSNEEQESSSTPHEVVRDTGGASNLDPALPSYSKIEGAIDVLLEESKNLRLRQIVRLVAHLPLRVIAAAVSASIAALLASFSLGARLGDRPLGTESRVEPASRYQDGTLLSCKVSSAFEASVNDPLIHAMTGALVQEGRTVLVVKTTPVDVAHERFRLALNQTVASDEDVYGYAFINSISGGRRRFELLGTNLADVAPEVLVPGLEAGDSLLFVLSLDTAKLSNVSTDNALRLIVKQ